MFHLLKLGPVPLSLGTTGVYLRIGEAGDPSAPVFEQEDVAGLRALLAGVEDPSQVRCEPALADAAAQLGLAVEPPPQAALSARAAIATFLAWGQRGLSGLGSDKALLFVQASTEYWDAKPWLHWDDGQPFVVDVTGAHEHTYEGCVFYADDGLTGLALYERPGALAWLLELQVHGQTEEAKALPAIAVSLEATPAYAVDALAAAGRVPRLPLPLKSGPQGVSVPSSLEALILVAALRAVARVSPEQPVAISSMVAGEARMDVRVRAPPPRVRN
ncbi:hypothetical protein D7V97_00965 [Corallococcus sp. CA053C]|uniref:hypothetical protein n=1 Tax=Corallococcus sp. CA053C TaxID=2316732 RepID=UPI000EA0302E|nr:hypothetical protein [Corallococcus sp. CA053C]RKH15215.1 hypothetical protein D7V97_00965 [Corallococcus sp. CA053C]